MAECLSLLDELRGDMASTWPSAAPSKTKKAKEVVSAASTATDSAVSGAEAATPAPAAAPLAAAAAAAAASRPLLPLPKLQHIFCMATALLHNGDGTTAGASGKRGQPAAATNAPAAISSQISEWIHRRCPAVVWVKSPRLHAASQVLKFRDVRIDVQALQPLIQKRYGDTPPGDLTGFPHARLRALLCLRPLLQRFDCSSSCPAGVRIPRNEVEANVIMEARCSALKRTLTRIFTEATHGADVPSGASADATPAAEERAGGAPRPSVLVFAQSAEVVEHINAFLDEERECCRQSPTIFCSGTAEYFRCALVNTPACVCSA